MIVYILSDDSPQEEGKIINVYKTLALARKAKAKLQGAAGDSFTWQYLEINKYTVQEKATV